MRWLGGSIERTLDDARVARATAMLTDGMNDNLLKVNHNEVEELRVSTHRNPANESESPPYCLDVRRLRAVIKANAFGRDDDDKNNTNLYLWPSFANHSCAPNAVVLVLGTDVMVIRARHNIKKGEQVTVDYRNFERNHTVQQRREILHSGWNFDCRCELCELETKHATMMTRVRAMMTQIQNNVTRAQTDIAKYRLVVTRRAFHDDGIQPDSREMYLLLAHVTLREFHQSRDLAMCAGQYSLAVKGSREMEPVVLAIGEASWEACLFYACSLDHAESMGDNKIWYSECKVKLEDAIRRRYGVAGARLAQAVVEARSRVRTNKLEGEWLYGE